MFETHWALVKDGKIELPENVELPEGSRVMVTVMAVRETDFRANKKETLFGEGPPEPTANDPSLAHK